jgi:hypothetical protein
MKCIMVFLILVKLLHVVQITESYHGMRCYLSPLNFTSVAQNMLFNRVLKTRNLRFSFSFD